MPPFRGFCASLGRLVLPAEAARGCVRRCLAESPSRAALVAFAACGMSTAPLPLRPADSRGSRAIQAVSERQARRSVWQRLLGVGRSYRRGLLKFNLDGDVAAAGDEPAANPHQLVRERHHSAAWERSEFFVSSSNLL